MYKYETVGDAYITASNLLKRDRRHRETGLAMAVTLVRVVGDLVVDLPDGGGRRGLSARVGLHTGPVAAGLVGLKRNVLTLVGDTLNVASRMESNGKPGCVQATEECWRGLPDEVKGLFEATSVEAKGKGTLRAYLLDVDAHRDALASLGLDLMADPGTWEAINAARK